MPFLYFFLIAVMSKPAFADILHLKNGDRLTGEVLQKTGETLTFKTAYSDKVSISWEHVASIQSEKELTLLMEDGRREQTQRISADQLVRIQSVNPPAWQLGEAWHFTGNIKIALELERGNNDTNEFDIDSEMTLRKAKNRFRLTGHYENDYANDAKTSDQGLGRLKYDYLVSKRTYVGGLLGAERDIFAELRTRVILGPFLGYKIIDTERTTLEAEAGLHWVEERYTSQGDDDYLAVGWDVGYDHTIITDRLSIYARSKGLLSLETLSRLVSRSRVGAKMPVGWGFATGSEVFLDYDSNPAAQAEELDTTYNVNLGYDW